MGFISMQGKLDLEVTRVLEVNSLALVIGVWSFHGTGPDGEAGADWRQRIRTSCVVRPTDRSALVIDNPWALTE